MNKNPKTNGVQVWALDPEPLRALSHDATFAGNLEATNYSACMLQDHFGSTQVIF